MALPQNLIGVIEEYTGNVDYGPAPKTLLGLLRYIQM